MLPLLPHDTRSRHRQADDGLVLVAPEGIENDYQLTAWFERALEFVKALPKK